MTKIRILSLFAALALALCIQPVVYAQAVSANDVGGDPCAVVVTTSGGKLTKAQCSVIVSSTDGSAQPVGTAASPLAIVGNVAHDGVDSGAPAKIGGKAAATLPTAVTVGDRVDAWYSPRGAAIVGYGPSYSMSSFPTVSTLNMTVDTSGNAGPLGTMNFMYDGTNMIPGLMCDASAVVSVTAGATTELVALVASKRVRVCAIAVSITLAGKAQFVYGTGTNCGTGTANLTGDISLATATPLTLAAPGGTSLFKTASANALCLKATTGDVTGFISYAQY